MAETVWARDKRIRGAVLTMGQTFYLVTLNQFVGNNPDAWPSQQKLANAMNATKRGVQKWQAELEAAGIIQVDVGKGRSSTNRYRLNLESLQPKQIENDEHSSPFTTMADEQMTNLVRPNDEHRAPEMTNTVRTERTVERTRKDHSWNSANSGRASGKKRTAKSDSKLIAFCTQWNAWHSAGIVRQKIRDVISPGKGIEDAWNRSQRDREQRDRLSDFAALREAIAASQQWLKDQGWFDAAGLIGGKNSNRRWYAEQLVAGVYRDKPSSGGRLHSPESAQAWQKTLDAIRRNPFDRAAIDKAVGGKASQVLKTIGGASRIEKATDFERRELEKQFHQAFNQE